MKIGFYDSGLGGISVLKKFLTFYNNQHSYFYYGDSARAPYGDKDPSLLLEYLKEIFSYMANLEVDIVISACNTTSAILDHIDMDDYIFDVISLHTVMQDYFKTNLQGSLIKEMQLPVALLATQNTINSKKYKSWGLNLTTQACPELVVLIEAGKLKEARQKWLEYLDKLDPSIKHVIVGCTHYSFLTSESDRFRYIDPSEIMVEYFKTSIYADHLLADQKEKKSLNLNLFFSKTSPEYQELCDRLLIK